MSIVEVSILNSIYKLSCGEGEEEKLKQLADQLNARLEKYAGSFRNTNDNKLLVINSLMMQSEINDLKDNKNVDIDDDLNNELLEISNQCIDNIAKKLKQL